MNTNASNKPTPPKLPSTATGASTSTTWTAITSLELLLRNPDGLVASIANGKYQKIVTHLLFITVTSFVVFGLVLGLFTGGTQLWAAPLKVTLGSLFATTICLPSLYIFTCLGGAQVSLKHIVVCLLGMLAVTGILLLGFAPVSWVFSQSTDSAVFFGFLNLVFWSIGIFFGARLLYRSVGARGNQVFLWFTIFLLVSLQLTATLRPLIGESDDLLSQEKKFFLTYWLEALN